MEYGSGADMLLRRYDQLCSLTPSDSASFKTELNLLLDELISENYSVARDNIRPEVTPAFLNRKFFRIL